MLPALKMSSLTCKCVFYRPELNAKREAPWNWIVKVLKWNIPMNRAQRVDERNGIICLVIMFSPRVMVFKMS